MKFGKLALVPDGPVGSKCDRTRVRASCLPRVFELKIKEFVRPFFRWDSVFCSDDNVPRRVFFKPESRLFLYRVGSGSVGGLGWCSKPKISKRVETHVCI